MQITSSAVSQLLNKLEKNGYIKRTINPNNRREILIELGETSIAYFEQLAQIEQSITEKYYAKLGMKDIQDLHRILHKLKNIITESE
ncbi:MarR family winged helix-turn-helix transcriptional regulator [Microbacteriaceae bacterium 4G12]